MRMRRVHGKVNYRHFGFHDPDDDMYYHYDNDVYLLIYKESGEFDYGHSLRVEYVLKDRSKREKKDIEKKYLVTFTWISDNI